MHVPASITRISLSGNCSFAPTTAAIRSYPSVSGVSYKFSTGRSVFSFSQSTGTGSFDSCANAHSLKSMTLATIAFSTAYRLQISGKCSNVLFESYTTSNGNVPSKSANFAVVFPISITRFTALLIKIATQRYYLYSFRQQFI